jgi:hypothetical protein
MRQQLVWTFHPEIPVVKKADPGKHLGGGKGEGIVTGTHPALYPL